jgi:chromosome segregation ATPase
MLNRDAYIAKLKAQLDQFDAKMDELEAKAKDAKEDARQKYKEEITKLRHQSKLTKDKFEELKAACEDKWDAMIVDVEKVRDAFIHSYNYFKSQL